MYFAPSYMYLLQCLDVPLDNPPSLPLPIPSCLIQWLDCTLGHTPRPLPIPSCLLQWPHPLPLPLPLPPTYLFNLVGWLQLLVQLTLFTLGERRVAEVTFRHRKERNLEGYAHLLSFFLFPPPPLLLLLLLLFLLLLLLHMP